MPRAPFSVALPFVVLAIAQAAGGCTCSKGGEAAPDASPTTSSDASEEATAPTASSDGGGLSAPIAAARIDADDVVIAGLDVAAKAIRVQRIDPSDHVAADRTVLEGVKWSSESDLKVVSAAKGAAVTWRGLRNGKMVRQMIVLNADLTTKGDIVDVTGASCATRDALWFSDGKRAHGRPWTGSAVKTELPREKDAALVCGVHRAFALLDEDDGTSVMPLGATGADAGAADAAIAVTPGAIALLKESDFGEDEQRERTEYTAGDDLGVVRVASSGALAIREVRDGVAQPLRKLKSSVGRDDDVVAVDASPKQVIVVYTQDVGDACPGSQDSTTPSTRVKAVRIDRATFEESVVELAPGVCGKELGPFFTGALEDAVSAARGARSPRGRWPDRRSRPPSAPRKRKRNQVSWRPKILKPQAG